MINVLYMCMEECSEVTPPDVSIQKRDRKGGRGGSCPPPPPPPPHTHTHTLLHKARQENQLRIHQSMYKIIFFSKYIFPGESAFGPPIPPPPLLNLLLHLCTALYRVLENHTHWSDQPTHFAVIVVLIMTP